MIYRLIQGGIIILIYLYQYSLSILFGPACRFAPCCSSYALLSVQRFGIVAGVWFTLKRLIKCHPFHPGGYDPVPEIPTKL